MLIVFCFIFFSQLSFGCDSIDAVVDSIFDHHIKSLEKSTTDIPDRKYTEDDFDFLYMLVYFDNFKFNTNNYSLQPMITKKDVEDIKDWYGKNRDVINKNKLLKLLICIRKQNHPIRYWNPETETFDEYVGNLEAELDALLSQ